MTSPSERSAASTAPVAAHPFDDVETRRARSGPLLRAYRAIAEQWRLTTEQQVALLGSPAKSTYYGWLQAVTGGDAAPPVLSVDQLVRITYVASIYALLAQWLGQHPAVAHAWVTTPNAHPQFGGQPPLHQMLREGVVGLAAVERHLIGLVGAPNLTTQAHGAAVAHATATSRRSASPATSPRPQDHGTFELTSTSPALPGGMGSLRDRLARTMSTAGAATARSSRQAAAKAAAPGKASAVGTRKSATRGAVKKAAKSAARSVARSVAKSGTKSAAKGSRFGAMKGGSKTAAKGATKGTGARSASGASGGGRSSPRSGGARHGSTRPGRNRGR